MRPALLGPLYALALAAGLAACGSGGGASSGGAALAGGASRSPASHRDGMLPRHAGRGARPHAKDGPATPPGQGSARRRPDPACTAASRCTPAAAAAPTFWPTPAHPARTGDGAVTYAPPPGEAAPPGPGEMAISSPAFARNEPLPAAYTCDGQGISPPLVWKDVPKGAAALLLVASDLGSASSSGAIRWIVADIDPHSKGVAAGQVPSGGVVGEDAEGKAAYGPLCPAHGAESVVSFRLYALSRPLSLPAGFAAAAAERAYAGHVLGKGAATTYALYVRP